MDVGAVRTSCHSLLVAALLCAGAAADDGSGPSLGDPAPPLGGGVLLGGDGDAAPDLAAWRGRVVVLEFFATWCGPCVEALPHLSRLHQRFAPRGVVFLAVSPEPAARLGAFLARHDVPYPVLAQEGRQAFDAFGVESVPTTVVVDAEGRLAVRARPEDVDAEVLERVLKGQDAGVPALVEVAPNLDDVPRQETGEILAEVVFRPSPATRAVLQQRPGSGRIRADGATLDQLIPAAWDVPWTRIEDRRTDAAAARERWSVRVRAPGADDALARRLLQAALTEKFGLRARWEEQEREVLLLRRVAGARPWEASVVPVAKTERTAFGGGLRMRGERVEFLRSWLENLLQTPVVDETGYEERYDLEMEWVDEASLRAEIARVGLRLDRERRRIPVLVLEDDRGR